MNELKQRGYAQDDAQTYAYLLDMPVSSFTSDSLQRMERSSVEARKELDESRALAAKEAREKVRSQMDAVEAVCACICVCSYLCACASSYVFVLIGTEESGGCEDA